MNRFPFTIGFEWELLILDENLNPVSDQEIAEIGNRVRRRQKRTEDGYDYCRFGGFQIYELRSGIIKKFNTIAHRLNSHWQILNKEIKTRKKILLPIASIPTLGCAAGFHIHLGSIYDVTTAHHIANNLTHYIPALIALSSNSPFWPGMKATKSNRILHHADYCSIPRRVQKFIQFGWGDDVCVKVGMKPTIEIRALDAPSFPILAIELVKFISFLIPAIKERRITAKNYQEMINNRLQASLFGLQATFIVDGKEIPVCEILKGLLERVDIELPLISSMVAKRYSQADLQIECCNNRDPIVFIWDYLNLIDRIDFSEIVKKIKRKQVRNIMSIEDYIYSRIQKDVRLIEIYNLLDLPFPDLHLALLKLQRQGKIKIKTSPERGTRIWRQQK